MAVVISGGAQAQTTFTIGDLSLEVIAKLENRSSDLSRAYKWMIDALLEIAGNSDFRSEFDELEILGPVWTLTPNITEYPFGNFITATDYNIATLDVFLWVDIPPTNAGRIQLDMAHYSETDISSLGPGQPAEWYRFGDTIGFSPYPDRAYQVQARVLRRHPINDQVPQNTQILLPREWNEILVWATVQRGWMELLNYQRAAEVHALIHGDPKHPERPGLINGLKKRREKENWRKQKALQPVVARYGY